MLFDHPPQERAAGHRVLCASVVLDRPPESLQQRVANKLYEACRAGTLDIGSFPDYKPLLSALQSTQVEDNSGTYHVTVKRHDKLIILSALANKFLESDEFGEDCRKHIEEHNEYFNKGGEYMADPEQTRTHLH